MNSEKLIRCSEAICKMAKESDSNSGKNLQGIIKEVCVVERKSYIDAKETVKYRAELRKWIMEALRAEQHLPASSEFFAGLKRTNGRVNYREVLDELRETGVIDDNIYTQLCEKHRKPGQRLSYGERKPEVTRGLWQEDFDFITPKGALK